jgi:hypothetical protein
MNGPLKSKLSNMGTNVLPENFQMFVILYYFCVETIKFKLNSRQISKYADKKGKSIPVTDHGGP